jgi:hypothetical protein
MPRRSDPLRRYLGTVVALLDSIGVAIVQHQDHRQFEYVALSTGDPVEIPEDLSHVRANHEFNKRLLSIRRKFESDSRAADRALVNTPLNEPYIAHFAEARRALEESLHQLFESCRTGDVPDLDWTAFITYLQAAEREVDRLDRIAEATDADGGAICVGTERGWAAAQLIEAAKISPPTFRRIVKKSGVVQRSPGAHGSRYSAREVQNLIDAAKQGRGKRDWEGAAQSWERLLALRE